MRKTSTTTAPKGVTFTANAYGKALATMIESAARVDATQASVAKAKNHWAKLAAAGISTNALTLEAVRDSIIARFPKAEKLADCGETAKGWFYDFQRVANAGALDRLLSGEALTTVRRSVKPKQEQKTGKRGKGKADKAKVISLNDCIAGLEHWIATASADSDKAKELAANPKLAALVQSIAKLSTVASAGATGARKVRPEPLAKAIKPRSRAGSGKVVAMPKRQRKAA